MKTSVSGRKCDIPEGRRRMMLEEHKYNKIRDTKRTAVRNQKPLLNGAMVRDRNAYEAEDLDHQSVLSCVVVRQYTFSNATS